MSNLIPLPQTSVRVRAGTMDDLAFIDALQKKHSKQVGWMPTQTLEGKIRLGHVLVATDVNDERVGYCIGNDQYFKRDDVGIIYQMNVVPGRQRGLIGATLLKAQFERSAYGCRLYCCWCAQDIAANKFWEAMGFVPLAFRTGSASKGPKGAARVHIFWQRRIRAGDTTTPWWFPSQTTGGSIREDRIVLPIPPGTHWSDAKPIVLPGMAKQLEAPTTKRSSTSSKPRSAKPERQRAAPITLGGAMRFAPPKSTPVADETNLAPQPKREPRKNTHRVKQKNDPQLVAAARELRDRWLEQVNTHGLDATEGKYDLGRRIETDVTIEVNALPSRETPLLAA